MMKRQAAALALALFLAAVPVQAQGLLNGTKESAGKTVTGETVSSSAPDVQYTGRFGEQYALLSGVPVVLAPEGSEIPAPEIKKNKAGQYTCSYAIDREKTYSANDQAIIKIIDSWNANGGKKTIEVQTKSGARQVTGTFDMSAAKKVFMSVNAKRQAAGLSALSWDAALADAAQIRAAEITVLNSHTRPDGTSCFTAAPGITGENIADGYATADVAMKEWMNSPGHKANILRSTFQQLGVAAFTAGGHTYWVQDFAGY